MVVVRVADHDDVDDWEVAEAAGGGRVALWTWESGGGAALLEDGVEEDAEPGGELEVHACVTEPGCAESGGGGAGGEEGRGLHGERRGEDGGVGYAGDAAPGGG